MKDKIRAMEEEALRIEEDATHTSKSLYNDAAMWSMIDGIMLVGAAVASAIAGFTALEVFDWGTKTIIAFSFLATLLVTTSKTLQPATRAVNCHCAGVKFQALKDKVRIYRTVDLLDVAEDHQIRSRLNALDNERTELRLNCPQPTQFGRLRARKGIEEGESCYQADN